MLDKAAHPNKRVPAVAADLAAHILAEPAINRHPGTAGILPALIRINIVPLGARRDAPAS